MLAWLRWRPSKKAHGGRNTAIAQSWRRHWEQVIPLFTFSAPIQRMIYTTNAIEALNSKLRRAVRTRGHFLGDEAAMKLLYLVLNHAAEQWKRPPREWTEAKNPVRDNLRRLVHPLMNETGPAHKITDSPPHPGLAEVDLQLPPRKTRWRPMSWTIHCSCTTAHTSPCSITMPTSPRSSKLACSYDS